MPQAGRGRERSSPRSESDRDQDLAGAAGPPLSGVRPFAVLCGEAVVIVPTWQMTRTWPGGTEATAGSGTTGVTGCVRRPRLRPRGDVAPSRARLGPEGRACSTDVCGGVVHGCPRVSRDFHREAEPRLCLTQEVSRKAHSPCGGSPRRPPRPQAGVAPVHLGTEQHGLPTVSPPAEWPQEPPQTFDVNLTLKYLFACCLGITNKPPELSHLCVTKFHHPGDRWLLARRPRSTDFPGSACLYKNVPRVPD